MFPEFLVVCMCVFTLRACVTYYKPKAAGRWTLGGPLAGLDCSHYLGPFFFLVGDLSEPADPGCCDFLGCASRLVICKPQFINTVVTLTQSLPCLDPMSRGD